MKTKYYLLLIIVFSCTNSACINRQAEEQMMPYIDFLIHEYGAWHWEYAHDIESLIQFGEDELIPLMKIKEEDFNSLEYYQDSIMIQKTLKQLRRHMNRYDYFYVHNVACLILRRHMYVVVDDAVNPQKYKEYVPDNPMKYNICFRRTPNAAIDSCNHIIVDASYELPSMLCTAKEEMWRLQSDTTDGNSWIAIEYSYKTGQFTNYINQKEITIRPDISNLMISQFADLKNMYPQIAVLRFCLCCPMEFFTE